MYPFGAAIIPKRTTMKKPGLFLFAAVAISCGTTFSVEAQDTTRQAAVAKRGADIMPFDLNATTHVFTKTTNGGIQRVIAKDANDSGQISLIRDHLRAIRAQFTQGDFSGPTHIHGASMPGLAELKETRSQASVQYREINTGAELVYSSENPQLVSAIHRWFDAQLSDHGSDAMAGHDHRKMHH
jgi:hypothetical protein